MLIKNIMLPKGNIADVRIKNDVFTEIADFLPVLPDDEVIDGTDKAILPAFYNAHTHSAMTLLRGFADDLPLFEWLSEHIWPKEASLTDEDIYLGTRLAVLEMIKSGTAFFNDMYWFLPEVLKATEEFGIRAELACPVMDKNIDEILPMTAEYIEQYRGNPLITFAVAPHAIYTCGKETLTCCAEFARKYNIRLHTHLAETKNEVADCLKSTGLTPVQYLNEIGVLDCKIVAAHCIHLSEKDTEILSKKRVTVAHCPTSNQKLASGIFNIKNCQKHNLNIALGTDGCSSNNNLDMREEAKFAALLATQQYGPDAMPVSEILKIATQNGAETFGINAGKIEVGRLADALIIDLLDERMVPLYNLASNWIYSAGKSCIESVLVAGKFVMQNRQVHNEKEIIDEVRYKFNNKK